MDWLNNLRGYGEALRDRYNYLRDLPNQASDVADQMFPGSARDSSTKNAFRHALGTGMLAQEVGNNLGGSVPARMLGASLAKMVGKQELSLTLGHLQQPGWIRIMI